MGNPINKDHTLIVIDARFLNEKGGIAHYFESLLWYVMDHMQGVRFVLLSHKALVLPDKYSTMARVEMIKKPAGLPHIFGKIMYAIWQFPRAVARLKPDLFWSPYYDVAVPFTLGSRSIITIHDLCFWRVPHVYSLMTKLWHKFILRLNLIAGPTIVTVSKTSQRLLSDLLKIRPEEIHVAYNSIELKWNNTKIENTVRRQEKILLYTGGVDARKNIPGLFNMISKMENCKLLVTGGFKNHPLVVQAINRLSSEQAAKIIFTESLSQSQLHALYAKEADALVHFSFDEGFGRSLLEAQYHGLPIACSDIEIFHEIAGSNAHYADPNDLQSMIKAVFRALDSQRSKNVLDDMRFKLESNGTILVNLFKNMLKT